jgi:hypothetical protein
VCNVAVSETSTYSCWISERKQFHTHAAVEVTMSRYVVVKYMKFRKLSGPLHR